LDKGTFLYPTIIFIFPPHVTGLAFQILYVIFKVAPGATRDCMMRIVLKLSVLFVLTHNY
jgi:hypothetical protein